MGKTIKYWLLLLLLITGGELSAATWSVFPVRVHGEKKDLALFNKEIDDEELAWDLARLVPLFLESTHQYNVFPVSHVKLIFKELKIRYNSQLTLDQLRTISYKTDSDNILILEVYISPGQITIESRIYYTHSDKISDKYTFRGEDFYKTLGLALAERFQLDYSHLFIPGKEDNYCFALEASGPNMAEVKALAGFIREIDIHRSCAIAIDGYGKKSILKNATEKISLLRFFDSLRPQSIDTTDKIHFSLVTESENLIRDNRSTLNTLFLLVATAPHSSEMQQKVRATIRRLGNSHKVHLLGSGYLSRDDRAFWLSIASEQSTRFSIIYSDILYKQRLGIATGEEVTIVKKGFNLYETNNGMLDYAHQLQLDTGLFAIFKPDNMGQVFEKQTSTKVLTEYPVEITPVENNPVENPRSSEGEYYRILVDFQGTPFWVTYPKKEGGSRTIVPEKGGNYFFLLNMRQGMKGIPFSNEPNFGKIIDPEAACRSLLLTPSRFLESPSQYLGKSLAGSSLMIFYGKVLEVTVEKTFVY